MVWHDYVGPDVTYMFKALWGGWLLFWLISARGNKRTAMAVGRRWLLAPLAVAAVVWLGGREFPEYVRRTVLPPSRMLVYLGFVITTAGLAFTVWARRALGTNWSGMPTIKQDHELITRGPYAVVRHPIYTGLLVAIFGSCLAEGHVWSVVFFAMARCAADRETRDGRSDSDARVSRWVSRLSAADEGVDPVSLLRVQDYGPRAMGLTIPPPARPQPVARSCSP